MSAFHDIWIGNVAPLFKRGHLQDWKKKGLFWESSSTGYEALLKTIESTEYQLVIIGQFYEPVDELALLKACSDYVEGKIEYYKDPSGHYILFLINKTDTSVKYVFTNRFGTYHAYWSTNATEQYITTYFLGLGRQLHRKKIDWQGLTGFLAMGFFPADTTYFEEIKIFKPASLYIFNNGTVTSKRYWNWTYDPRTSDQTEALESLHQSIKRTVSYSVQNRKVALPISGGLDSRLLAGIVGEIGTSSTWSFGYGYSQHSIETKIAKQVAEKIGMSFNSYKIGSYLFNNIDKAIDSAELFQYVDGTRQIAVVDEISSNSDCVIGGHWGDVWFDTMHLPDVQDPYGTYFERSILKKGSNWLLQNIASNYLSNPHNYLHNYFSTEINQYNYIENADCRLKAYKTDQWSFRWTLASIRTYQLGAFPVLPFYDNHVADVFSTIPGHMLEARKLEIEFIKRYYKSLADITWQEYGSNLYRYKYLNNRNYLYRAFKKLQRNVTGKNPVQRNWEINYLSIEGKKYLQQNLLNGSLKDIVREEKLREIIEEFYRNPGASHGYTISILHTIALFFKKVYGE